MLRTRSRHNVRLLFTTLVAGTALSCGTRAPGADDDPSSVDDVDVALGDTDPADVDPADTDPADTDPADADDVAPGDTPSDPPDDTRDVRDLDTPVNDVPDPDAADTPDVRDADPEPDADTDVGTDPCARVTCEDCFVCEDGECVQDLARADEEEIWCGSGCGDWPNYCSIVWAFHYPVRPGACFDADQSQLCNATGGFWEYGLATHGSCDAPAEPSFDECVFACDCGDHARWDPERGCLRDPACDDDTGCHAEAACYGAWLRNGVCVGPAGQSYADVCCEGMTCFEAETAYIDPITGTCEVGNDSCAAHPFSQSCDPDTTPPCELGVFIESRGQSAACWDSGTTRNVSAVLRPFTDTNVTISSDLTCRSSWLDWTGIADGYDFFDNCLDGDCDPTEPAIVERTYAPGSDVRFETITLRLDGGSCNEPIALDTYTFAGTFREDVGPRVCYFGAAWVSLLP